MNGHIFLHAVLLGLLRNAAATVNVGSQIVGLVVHIESRRSGHERQWAVRSSFHDSAPSYYTRLASFSEEEVISAERAKWLVHNCEDGYVCFQLVENDPEDSSKSFKPHNMDSALTAVADYFSAGSRESRPRFLEAR